jgi:hypothetical protein
MKVAIVGTAPSTFKEAPLEDPSWKVYGLAKYAHSLSRCDVIFEIHRKHGVMGDGKDYWTRDYLKFLKKNRVIGYNVAFPFKKVEELRPNYPRDWNLQSSLSYMIAYAILEGATEIGVWGVDLVDTEEYIEQKPFVEGWLCFAEGKGIKITIPEKSALFSYNYKYGVDSPDGVYNNTVDKNDFTDAVLGASKQCLMASEQYKDHPIIAANLKGQEMAFIHAVRMWQVDKRGGNPLDGFSINHAKILEYISSNNA